MSTEEVKDTFDVIEKKYAGCAVDLDMSGGEFSMRKDAAELAEYARTKRIHFSSLVLDTMAVPLAKPELARALGHIFSRANVSVHAADADVHAKVSASKTDFDDLRAGLENIFRYFPAVFTNTSINCFNYDRLTSIAKFVLKARKASGRDTPLDCAYYLPVYRLYGEAVKENQRRLQDVDNTQFLPPGDKLDDLAVEFDRARSLLQLHGATAQLRDFNYPACVYRRVTGTYPENSYGLPNFMNDAYFTDYNHPMEHGYTLEEVYPSMFGRVKDPACSSCVAEPVCPGITAEWRKQGYDVHPIDEAEYGARFPEQLLSKVLQSIVFDPVELSGIIAMPDVDWLTVQTALYARLSGRAADVREARDNISSFSIAARARALCDVLDESGARQLAARLTTEIARLERIGELANEPDAARSAEGEGESRTPIAQKSERVGRAEDESRIRRLPLVS
jgi:hypothetical protein